MKSNATFSGGKVSASYTSKDRDESERGAKSSSSCDFDIHIDARGDVNIYNCSSPSGSGETPPCPTCFPPAGTCIPVAAGAKHKLSREQKLNTLAKNVRVPSALAAGTMHLMRRFLLGKTAANPLEAAAFTTLRKISRDTLSCTLTAFDAVPLRQRNRLFAQSLFLDPDQPLDGDTLATALAQEIKQRVGEQIFDDPNATEQERPGRIRLFPPSGEIPPNQIRICRINDLRTVNFIPLLNIGDYLPAEIQHDCETKIVDGQPQVVCQVRTSDCPGNVFADGTGNNVCLRVQDIGLGDSVVLQGVNYFSVDAKVRFTDRESGAVVRDVDAFVVGDVDTPVTEVVNGQTVLINDCRVHDRLTFQVPDDLAPKIYQFQVVVPNITGDSAFGTELVSDSEFLNVLPPLTARFEIVTEQIIARRETEPQSFGSDEVGLHTLAFPLFFDGTFGTDESQRTEQRFKDIQDVDFDSGTHRDITRIVFKHDQPILGMVMSVRGDEIDSQRAYDEEVTSSLDFFIDLVKDQAKFIGAALAALGGISALAKLGWTGAIIAGIAALITIGVDIIIALWAPADPIIRDSFGLSLVDLATLTSANAPAPDKRTFKTEDDIVVNVNKTIPPLKLPLEYHETREYVSDDQDSRYEITYRFNRVA